MILGSTADTKPVDGDDKQLCQNDGEDDVHDTRTIRVGQQDYPIGQVIERGGFSEVYYPPENESALACSELIMRRVLSIGRDQGQDLANQTSEFYAVVYDEDAGTYICIEVSGLTTEFGNVVNLERDINIYLSDGTSIEATVTFAPRSEGNYGLIPPSRLFVHIQAGIDIQAFRDRYRVYGGNKERVLDAPDMHDAVADIINRIKGKYVNPLEIIYGDYSEAQIIKEHMPERDLIIDLESRRVLEIVANSAHRRLGEGRAASAIEHDYDVLLATARKELEEDLLRKGFFNLADRLKLERP